jgi:hypothetical protein
MAATLPRKGPEGKSMARYGIWSWLTDRPGDDALGHWMTDEDGVRVFDDSSEANSEAHFYTQGVAGWSYEARELPPTDPNAPTLPAPDEIQQLRETVARLQAENSRLIVDFDESNAMKEAFGQRAHTLQESAQTGWRTALALAVAYNAAVSEKAAREALAKLGVVE